ATVGASGHADVGIAVGVLDDVVALGEQVEHAAGIGHLVVERVQVDAATGVAETSGGVHENDVPVLHQLRGLLPGGALVTTEPVCQDDGGSRLGAGSGVRGGEHRDVQRDR